MSWYTIIYNLHSRKPKNQRVKRALENKEPKIFENDKNAMFIKGGNISEQVAQALKELVWKYIILIL